MLCYVLLQFPLIGSRFPPATLNPNLSCMYSFVIQAWEFIGWKTQFRVKLFISPNFSHSLKLPPQLALWKLLPCNLYAAQTTITIYTCICTMYILYKCKTNRTTICRYSINSSHAVNYNLVDGGGRSINQFWKLERISAGYQKTTGIRAMAGCRARWNWFQTAPHSGM